MTFCIDALVKTNTAFHVPLRFKYKFSVPASIFFFFLRKKIKADKSTKEVYDFHQYTSFLVIQITNTKVHLKYRSTIAIDYIHSDGWTEKYSCIIYDKQKKEIKSWGRERYKFYDDVHIDNFRDKLYQVFKKDKEKWNEDNLFVLTALSAFIRLFIEEFMTMTSKLKSIDQLHYLFVVPSEWEEEIRETLLRPIFIQSNLLSKSYHNDKLLFCSDLESLFYNVLHWERYRSKTIFYRFCPVSENEILIKLDLVSTVNRLFDFPNSLLYPNVERSNSLYLTIDTFTDGIKVFIKDKLPLSIQEEIVQIIMDKEYKEDEEYEEGYLNKPLFTDTSRWELDKDQQDFIASIRIFDICSQVRENTTNNIDDLLSNDIIKVYNILSYVDLFSFEISLSKNLLTWSINLLIYDRTYSRNKNIVFNNYSYRIEATLDNNESGACRYIQDVINNSNIYSGPRILPVENSANSSTKK